MARRPIGNGKATDEKVMPISTKYVRPLVWREIYKKAAFEFDLVRIRRLQLLSDSDSQFYAWDAFYCWRLLNKPTYYKSIASILTVAPFSLRHSIGALGSCMLQPVVPSLIRRTASECLAKSVVESDLSDEATFLFRLALLVATKNENRVTDEQFWRIFAAHYPVNQFEATFYVEILIDNMDVACQAIHLELSNRLLNDFFIEDETIGRNGYCRDLLLTSIDGELVRGQG